MSDEIDVHLYATPEVLRETIKGMEEQITLLKWENAALNERIKQLERENNKLGKEVEKLSRIKMALA